MAKEEKDNKPADEPQETEDINENPSEPWLTDEDTVDLLNVRWRQVIDNLMSGQKIHEAYASAYDIDTSTPRGYNVANANGSRLLRNANFRDLWKKVIEERGFNDETADWELTNLITNPGIEPAVRRAAIKDYNELRGRVVKKIDHTTKGKEFQPPPVISEVATRNAADQAETAAGS